MAMVLASQVISIRHNSKLLLLRQQFDDLGVRFSFAYGLGVFPQAGYKNTASKPQLDVIHVVENTMNFHRINAARYPKHYSSIIHLGDSALKWIQNFGAGVYFNPYVTMKDDLGEDVVVKYGVVSSEIAFMDVRNWTSLYIAGRLQKPVKHFNGGSNDLETANEYNLESALNLSLLIITKKNSSYLITASQLYEQIALISYMGDPRMVVGGENPNKVKNIVKKQFPYFEKLYRKAIECALSKHYLKKHGNFYDVTLNVRSAADIVAHLPITFRRRFFNFYKKKHTKLIINDKQMLRFLEEKSLDAFDFSLPSPHADHPYISEILRDATSKRVLLSTVLSIIASPALAQSVKGVLTAGPVKSFKYAWEKKLKSFNP